MNNEIFAALLKRFKKTDDKQKALQDIVTGQGNNIAEINKQLKEAIESIPEDIAPIVAKNFRKLEDDLQKLTIENNENSSKKAVRLNEIDSKFSSHFDKLKNDFKYFKDYTSQKLAEIKTIKGPKGDPGDPGEDGIGVKELFINAEKHWIIIYTDGRRVDLGKAETETETETVRLSGGGGVSMYQVRRLLSDNYVPYEGAIKAFDMGIYSNESLNGLLPDQTSNNNKVLLTDGSNTSWETSSRFSRVAVDFTSQTSINVTHNNGFKPNVTVLNENNFEEIPNNIEHTSDNAFTVSFSTAQTGSIIYDSSDNATGGAAFPNVVRVKNNYTVLTTDGMIECYGDNDFSVTLPTAVGVSGQLYEIPHTGTGIITLITADGELVGGAKCLTINPGVPGMFPSVSVRSNNIGWVLV